MTDKTIFATRPPRRRPPVTSPPPPPSLRLRSASAAMAAMALPPLTRVPIATAASLLVLARCMRGRTLSQASYIIISYLLPRLQKRTHIFAGVTCRLWLASRTNRWERLDGRLFPYGSLDCCHPCTLIIVATSPQAACARVKVETDEEVGHQQVSVTDSSRHEARPARFSRGSLGLFCRALL